MRRAALASPPLVSSGTQGRTAPLYRSTKEIFSFARWLLLGSLAACHFALSDIEQAAPLGREDETVEEIQVPAGFRAVEVVEGLNYPSSIVWDGEGRLFILESHTVPLPMTEPRILRLVPGEEPEELELTGAAAPTGGMAVGIDFHDGWLYWSHEQEDGTWGISRVRPEGGAVEAVLRDLPGTGDHFPNYLVHDAAGTLYFGVGSATNSGVVSSQDPVNQKWLEKRPAVHDIPCRDLVLAGATFTDPNELTKDDADDSRTTGVYQAYGSAAARRVDGEPLCTGAVYRLRPGAAEPELLAWGFRNPVAVALDSRGELLIGMHGADIRGTRPVLDDPDAIYRLRRGAWYGWPDYSASLEPLTERKYQPPQEYLSAGHDGIEFVIDQAASGLEPPDRSLLVTALEPHAAVGGMTVVPEGGPFDAWAGQLLVSEMGDFRPTTDATQPDVRAGFQIEAVDLASGERSLFARNRGDGDPRPASMLDLEDGFERPVDVKVGPDGLVYVLDFGIFQPTATAAKILPKTGKLFRVEPVARPDQPTP